MMSCRVELPLETYLFRTNFKHHEHHEHLFAMTACQGILSLLAQLAVELAGALALDYCWRVYLYLRNSFGRL